MKTRTIVTLGSALMLAAPATPVFAQGNLANPAALNERSPATWKARFDTSKGAFVVEVNRDWSPNGADRFYNLVKNGFYDGVRFFRVLDGFMAQFGISGDPNVSTAWRPAMIPVDPVKQSNTRGRITYAMGKTPATRTTQVFINYGDNSRLDGMGFAPFGQVASGMKVVDSLFSGYGEGAGAPDQGRVQMEGNAYLTKAFPKLDFVKKATIEK